MARNTGFASLPFVMGALSFATLSCSPAPSPRAAPQIVPSASASAAAVIPDAAVAARPVFRLVAVDASPGLYATANGTLLARLDANYYDPFHELHPDGAVTALESLNKVVKPQPASLGTVTGSWPGALFVEVFQLAGRAAPARTRTLVVRGDAKRASVERVAQGARFLETHAWKGGATLALRVAGPSTLFESSDDRAGTFEVLAPAKLATPTLPKDAYVGEGFVAYPSGRIVVLGGRRSRPVVADEASEHELTAGYMIDRAMVWETDETGGPFHATQLPGTTARMRLRGGLTKGAHENETYAWGELERFRAPNEPYLARMGKDGWERLALSVPLVAFQRAGDGSLWAIGARDPLLADAGLYRVTIEGRSASLVRVEIAPSSAWAALDESIAPPTCSELHPHQVVARSVSDVWVVAKCTSTRQIAADVLLHTQNEDRIHTFAMHR